MISLLEFLAACLFLAAPSHSQSTASDYSQVRDRLRTSIGKLPWKPAEGYRLAGRFVYKGTGEEIEYETTYLRLPDQWVADFSHAGRTRGMRYGFGPHSWVSSPEITAEVKLQDLPFCARYDFPALYAELLDILDQGKSNPLLRVASDGTETYVRGKLRDGLEATFLISVNDYFPRKVSINCGDKPLPGWTFATLEPSRSAAIIRLPAIPSDRFELRFSEPVGTNGCRYPRRTDYVDRNGVVGSFFLENGGPVSRSDPLLIRPIERPWDPTIKFRLRPELHRPSLYLGEADLTEFRARLESPPWRGWRRTNGLAAAWASMAHWLPALVPSPRSPMVLALVLAILLGGFIMLLRRRFQLSRQKFPWVVLAFGGLVWVLVLLSGIAVIQLHSPTTRSLIALHSAIRYAVTGDSFHAQTTRRLLRTLPNDNPPASSADLAHACQAYALAYDLVSPVMARAHQAEIERTLYDYAEPLYAAMQGWRSDTGLGSTIAAGLGMVGLAIGCEDYVKTAQDGLEKGLQQQLEGGLHREGPGPGSMALDDTANLMFALKRAGKRDFYIHSAFQDGVQTTLQLLSPVGTLPLFGATSLDQAVHAIPFLLKVANYLPKEVEHRCVMAHDSYWRAGRYSTRWFSKIVASVLQPHSFFFSNPYVMFQYRRVPSGNEMQKTSSVLGNGQVVVLQCGTGSNSVYLALNALRAPVYLPHRDVLTFDLYAYDGLLLHGPGFPGLRHPGFPKSIQTASANSITFNGASQAGTRCTGIVTPLLNQPLFDHVRILADRIYDQGQVQRDVVMVRPDTGHPPYFLLVDEVHATGPDSRVQWYLHGKGKLRLGLDQKFRWACAALSPPSLSSAGLTLDVATIGFSGAARSDSGRLYYENSILNQDSETLILEWTGSARFCTVLYPRKPNMPEPGFQPVAGTEASRVGSTDWICLGDLETKRSAGSLRHISEYVVVRERQNNFPALLMVAGVAFQMGPHSITSNKPVTVSLDGLRGSLRNSRPDTRVDLRSPEIGERDLFLLDGNPVVASARGALSLLLTPSGEHQIRPGVIKSASQFQTPLVQTKILATDYTDYTEPHSRNPKNSTQRRAERREKEYR